MHRAFPRRRPEWDHGDRACPPGEHPGVCDIDHGALVLDHLELRADIGLRPESLQRGGAGRRWRWLQFG
jgi:hypothetical protein